ncbi:MAG: hypothetical protein A2275_13755 [Bacteroidetes bacterium RIFOXYA12_FULL_35_11]|nr:MAG: hypothetical protein A2X01_13330 [Bacteroidetes bacterium GWF2_35_48]OFY80381.1 MAG: hypothetical protein A2275_13755 [Bacteroidetes bacterium RIFOXYA12_FULL_35_11]OFY92772.1 MAG: hypothetical protein A2491_05740 [Bacteroidetes bacterium RIFOXYC12_FULL_35_7]OFY96050.1 MAG: hypothetical protein A2309_14490 [Bacteroidetes bacterium RIFOXYB2_FULL_35_7]HBX50771.1 hypothetical protein [Bacteroidales bacterium]
MKKLLKLFVIVVMIGAVVTSCKKREETPLTPESDYQTGQDDVFAQQTVQKTFTSVNNYGINDDGIKGDRPYYITVEGGVGVWPKKMTINFDLITAADAAIKEGRSGIVYAEFSGPWKKDPAPNTSVTVTFNNYKVNGILCEGTVTVTYLGQNSVGGPTFNIKATNMKFTFTNGENMLWTTDRSISWIEGFEPPANLTSDQILNYLATNYKYEIWGTNSGTNSKGSAYSAAIQQTNPLVFRYCPTGLPISKGTIVITQSGVAKTINFGDVDECDNKVTITIGVITIDLTLRS